MMYHTAIRGCSSTGFGGGFVGLNETVTAQQLSITDCTSLYGAGAALLYTNIIMAPDTTRASMLSLGKSYETTGIDIYCAPGYSGPRCEACTNNVQFFDGQQCSDYPDKGQVALLIGMAACVAYLLFAGFLGIRRVPCLR
jgi:hypothetical protein